MHTDDPFVALEGRDVGAKEDLFRVSCAGLRGYPHSEKRERDGLRVEDWPVRLALGA